MAARRFVPRAPQQHSRFRRTTPDLLPAGEARGDRQLGPDRRERAEDPRRIRIVTQLQQDLTEEGAYRSRGRIERNKMLGDGPCFREPMLPHQRRRQHQMGFLVAPAAQRQRLASVAFRPDQIPVPRAGAARPLQVEPRQLGAVPCGERIARHPTLIEGQVQLQHFRLGRPSLPRLRSLDRSREHVRSAHRADEQRGEHRTPGRPGQFGSPT
jgi:hypothetical protein